MRPAIIQPPPLFTDDDVTAVDLEIDAAMTASLGTAAGEPSPGEEHDPIDGLLDEGFFEQAMHEQDLSDGASPGDGVLPAGNGWAEAGEARPAAGRPRDGMDGFHSSALAVAALVPAVAFALGAASGNLRDDIAWDAAPAVVLAGLLAAAPLGYARRATVAFAACVNTVYLARVTADAFGPSGTPWTTAGAVAAGVLLAAAGAYLALPYMKRSPSPAAARREPSL